MITRADFAVIDLEVREAIQKTLDDLRIANPQDYVLFLADGEYKREYDTPQSKLSPYVIDYRMDKYNDETRLKFMSEFLNLFYKFPAQQVATDDNEQRMQMELMIYSHIWEAKPFLKKLYRLAHLNNGEEYNWDVIIPEMGKHDFIINDIRQTFENKGSALTEVIRNGFHTSLRNAFAHSEYFFDTMNGNRRIWLGNYHNKVWELQEISFNDWSRRFLYSALLSFYLLKLSHENRVALNQVFQTDAHPIKHIRKDKAVEVISIRYRQDIDSFSFK